MNDQIKINADRQMLYGVILFVLSVIISRAVLFGGFFVDEADNLAVGALMSQGTVLYKDVFSHHFPFPYFWISIFMYLFGNSILIGRMSLVFFRVISFLWAMKVTRAYLPIGLISFLWSLVAHFLGGHFATYSSFLAISLVSLFYFAFFALMRNIVSTEIAVAIGVFSGISILTSPFSIYPIAIVYIFLLVNNKKAPQKVFLSGAVLVSFGIVFLVYSLLTNSFYDFIQQAILFNTNVYAKYNSTIQISYTSFVRNLFNLLGLFSKWELDPLRILSIWNDNNQNWLFIGFLLRLSVIATSVALVLQRKFYIASFVYFFATALLSMQNGYPSFHLMPFILFGFSTTAYFLLGITSNRFSIENKLIHGSWLIAYGIIASLSLWLVFMSTVFISKNADMLTHKVSFERDEKLAKHITRDLACGEDIYIGFYPGNPYVNFFAEAKPISKYMFLYPWVAEIGEKDVIEFADNNMSVIYLYKDLPVWGYQAEDYLSDLLTYLNANYIEVEPDLYVHPQLLEICPQDLEKID